MFVNCTRPLERNVSAKSSILFPLISTGSDLRRVSMGTELGSNEPVDWLFTIGAAEAKARRSADNIFGGMIAAVAN